MKKKLAKINKKMFSLQHYMFQYFFFTSVEMQLYYRPTKKI